LVFGLCHCGCEMPTSIARQHINRDGATRGLPRVFVSGHARKVLRYDCRGPLTRSGVPAQRVGQLVLFLRNEYGTWQATAEAVGIPEATLRMTVRRNIHASRRVALCVVEAIRVHQDHLRAEAEHEARQASNAQREMYRANARARERVS
jgi:hypothetical protein